MRSSPSAPLNFLFVTASTFSFPTLSSFSQLVGEWSMSLHQPHQKLSSSHAGP
ncbi:hypothetical protein MPTK1_5g01820 [Marchantia polymorpha subsp. ruderalis]